MRTARGIALLAVVAALACEENGGAPCNPTSGHPYDLENDRMPDVEMRVGDTVAVPLEDHFFLRKDCLELARSYSDYALFEAESSSEAVAVWLENDLTTLTIFAVEVADSVRVVVTNLDFWDYPLEFLVSVGETG